MTTLGVILARSGSQGLPGKHERMLCGRPVLAYTFDHAWQSRRLTHVVLTTDDDGLRRMAGRSGIATINRPPELATSDASVQGVMVHALYEAESRWHLTFDSAVVLYGNVPVRPHGLIDRAVDLLTDSGCDSVRSFCPVGKWHPAWMAKLDEGRVTPLRPGSIHRRQDLEPLYLHDGGVVAVSRASLMIGEENPDDPHAFFGSDRRGVETAAGDVVEVDHLRDLYWAEAALRVAAESSTSGMRASA